MSAPLIEAQGLEKHYGTVHALRGVDLSVEPGEVVGFLGPNGAGKTTTMKILTGSIAPSSGRARIAGYDLLTDPLQCRRHIGYLPQDPPLYPEMTVAAYLDHVARLKGVARAYRRREVVEAMERCSILEVEQRHLHKLSGGNRQRVGLAQALLGAPPMLILDEATAGLDPTQVARFRDLVRSLASDHGILLSTHILSEVEYCCRRVVMIHRGTVVLQASVAELRQRAAAQSILRLRLREGGPQGLAQVLEASDWAQDIRIDEDCVLCRVDASRRAELVAAAEAHGGLRELHEERRSLEEVFADVVADAEAPEAMA
ncbi:MAG: ABC transporter ATP-binding protein [Planctomycetota bacterium]|nr:MAG: ABC transporter ATP-binding protein [Planctomycetota bacterium]